jgi:hypothetical protein
MSQWKKWRPNGWQTWVVALALSATLVYSGCGGDSGPQQYHVSGTVTFGGQPVAGGSILFEPDASKGNQGPAGYAKIKDGKYDTKVDGKGPVGGPHTVTITGLNDEIDPDLFPEGKPIFQDYKSSVDLPKEQTTQNFDVPQSAATPAQAPAGPIGP